MNWLTWTKGSTEIIETDGEREEMVEYATTSQEDREYAREQGARIVIK